MSEWIKTSEKLPIDLDRVDVLINGQRRVTDVEFFSDNSSWWYWKTTVGWKEIKNNVTHWMPLPPPLKK